MERFTTHIGTALPLRRSSVDTDQILPAEFLKRTTRTGYADGLFASLRSDPSFPLDQERYSGASILIADRDFGIGSSREHAVWALWDHGFRVILSPRFGDIFRNNASKSGMLAAVVDEATISELWDRAERSPAAGFAIDLEQCVLRVEDVSVSFEVEPGVRARLLAGEDDIDVTTRLEEMISSFESTRPSWKPVVN